MTQNNPDPIDREETETEWRQAQATLELLEKLEALERLNTGVLTPSGQAYRLINTSTTEPHHGKLARDPEGVAVVGQHIRPFTP